MGGGGGNAANIVDALKDMEDRIKDFSNETFATKLDLDDLMGARVKTPDGEPAEVGSWPDAELSKYMKASDMHHNRILRNEKCVDELKRMFTSFKKEGENNPSD